MMRIPHARLRTLDTLSDGRVGQLLRRGAALRSEIEALGKRLKAHEAASWLARTFKARGAQADLKLMEAKREEAALLTCETVRLIAEINANDERPRRDR